MIIYYVIQSLQMFTWRLISICT